MPAVARFAPWRTAHHRLCLCLALLALLAACGGGGDSPAEVTPPPPPPPPPAVNQSPTPRFDAPTAVTAGQAAVFDARASTDPEGSALRYTWDFGDGSAAGTAQVAHLYSAAGTYTAKLMVSDAQGATAELTRSVTVSAAPVAVRSVSVAGRVSGIDGLPLAGVSVTVQGRSGAGSSANTDAQGRVTLSVGVGVNVVLRLAKAGYTDQVQQLTLPTAVGSDGSFEASLMPRAAALTLADAAAGGNVMGTDGASLTLPAAALVDAATGAAVTGPVQISLTPVDVNAAAVAAFPGRFEGITGEGARTPIISFGTTEFVLTQAGRALQLKPGQRASIDLPVYASQDLGGAALVAGGSLPLWSLDERSAQWIQEGQGTLVASAASPTGLTLRADVGHFSWWNADKGYTPYRPKPRCINDVSGQYDSIFEQATICKMLAEMDKPIPAQGGAATAGRAQAMAARPAAAASAPRFPFPAVRIDGTVPMAGGVALDIPPDYDVVLTGTALNGTWRGQVKVKGGQGVTADVVVPLRPLAAGGTSEAITLPFDAARTSGVLRVDSYRFNASAGQGVDITVSPDGSNLKGVLRLSNAAGAVLDSAEFGPSAARFQTHLALAGEYTIEMQSQVGAVAGYRLQASNAMVPLSVPSLRLGSAPPLGTPAVVSQGSQALALWVQAGTNGPELVGSRYISAAQGWTSATPLVAAPGYDDSNGLQAHVDDSGQVWVAWTENSGPRVARGPLAAGTAWAAPLALASANCSGGLAQRLAVNPAGQAVMMWQRRGSSAGWCARRFDSGAWAAEAVIASTPPTAGATLALAVTASGQTVAAWPLDNFGGLAVAQHDVGAQSWTAPMLLVGANSFVSNPAIAAAADGSLLLAWQGSGAVLAAHRPVGQAWSPAQRLGDSGSSANPQVAWLGGDGHVVAFNSFSGGPRVVEHRAATGWGPLQPVSTDLSLGIAVSLAAGADGSAVLVSLANSRAGAGLELGMARRNPATAQWVNSSIALAPKLLSSGSSQLWRYAPLSLHQGTATALWLEPTGSPVEARLRAARFLAVP